jgi:hypothetical protein
MKNLKASEIWEGKMAREKWLQLFDQEFPAKGRGIWVNNDPNDDRRNYMKNFIKHLLKERDKEWLSCLPEKIGDHTFVEFNDGITLDWEQIKGFDYCIGLFNKNAKAKKLI